MPSASNVQCDVRIGITHRHRDANIGIAAAEPVVNEYNRNKWCWWDSVLEYVTESTLTSIVYVHVSEW
jgi:hypothetical protein